MPNLIANIMKVTSSSPAIRRQKTRRSSNIDTSSVDLPDEIIELILSKCPVKSAVRFKSVSKSWLSIISDPRFFQILQSKLSENQKTKFLITLRSPRTWSVDCLIRFEDGEFHRESMSVYPCGKYVSPLCSCDGLILLFDDVDEDFMLWNPLIRNHIIIPAFTPKTHPDAFTNWPDTRARPWLFHLYFDSITNDYKIVFLYTKCYTIYSCKNGRWGEIKDIPDNLHCNVCVDGCIYQRDNGEVLCFDTRDEKLHKFPQPKGVEYLVDVKLVEVTGRLCLYGFGYYKRLQLWVMEENGSSGKRWRELISEKPCVRDLEPVCLSNEDDVVLCGKHYYGTDLYKYFIYNSRKNCSFQEIKVDSTLKPFIPHFGYEYYPYSENLYMPNLRC